MKIIYLSEININKPSNLLSKMNAQIEEWTALGHQVYVVSFPSEYISNTKIYLSKNISGYFSFENYLAKKVNNRTLFGLVNKVLSIKRYKEYIKKISPDIIYLREMVGFPGMASVLKNNKVVLESNTLLLEELRLNSRKLFKLAQLFQQGINKKIDGFIGVTNEITNQYLNYNKPAITIANGIKIIFNNRPAPVNERPQLVLVCSPNMPWHGQDKFTKMANLLQDVDFHLVGPSHSITTNPLKNLFYHGYKTGKELNEIYSKMDIGIGTLALHRNNMTEACPLKVREYAAIGLPLILGYEDTDLSGKNFDFILQLENVEENIEKNIEKIRQFIFEWKGKRIPLKKIEPFISIEFKEKTRLEFFEQIRLKV